MKKLLILLLGVSSCMHLPCSANKEKGKRIYKNKNKKLLVIGGTTIVVFLGTYLYSVGSKNSTTRGRGRGTQENGNGSNDSGSDPLLSNTQKEEKLIEAIHKIETEIKNNHTADRGNAIAAAEQEAIDIINSDDIDLNAEYTGRDVDGFWQQTPLYAACRRGYTKIVKALLDKGAELKPPIEGETLLHIATEYGRLDTVKFLIDSKDQLGIDIDAENKDGETALFVAYQYGKYKLLEHLVNNGANPLKQDRNGKNILHHACKYREYESKNDLKMVKALRTHQNAEAMLKTKNNYGDTPLHIACEKQYELWKVVKTLLAFPNAKEALSIQNNLGRTPLHEACCRFDWGTEGLELLLEVEDGADPNAQDKEGKTPLHLAASSGDEEKVKLLLKKGANPDIKDAKNRIPVSRLYRLERNRRINNRLNKASNERKNQV